MQFQFFSCIFFIFFSVSVFSAADDNPLPGSGLTNNPHYLCYQRGIVSVDRISDIHEWKTVTAGLRSHGWILKSSGTLNHSQDEWIGEVDAEKLKKVLMGACGAVIGIATTVGSIEIIMNIVNEAVECFASALKKEDNGKLVFTSTGKKEIAIRHSIIESSGYRYVAGYFLSFERTEAMKTNPLYSTKKEMVICNGSVDFFEILPDFATSSATSTKTLRLNLTGKNRPKAEPPKAESINQGGGTPSPSPCCIS